MHKSVLKKEVMECLDPESGENFIDCTFGLGGHALDILKKNKPGKVLGIELDKELYEQAKEKDIERLVLANDSYVNLKKIVKDKNFKPVNGILMDLGFSSWHLEQGKRGFSFLKDEPLDMRYNPELAGITAAKIVNEWKEKDIAKILKEYGEERFARKISFNIAKLRKSKPIKTTFELVEVIEKSVPSWYRRRRMHPATKTFQALRIAVNDELENLKSALADAADVLAHDGRLVVISFHSLEDRIVKNFLKNSKSLKTLTKKPIRPTKQEIIINPRSRSAKLRAALKE